MKKYFFLIVLSSSIIYCQKTSWFFEGAAFLTRELYKSTYVKFDLGLDYKLNHFINPEIEINYYVGLLNDKENINSQNIQTDILQRKFNAYGISFNPKILISFTDDNHSSAVIIIPRYSFTKINANGTYTQFNNIEPTKCTNEDISSNEIRHSIGIGIGIINYVSERNDDRLSINLYYDGIDFGNSLSNLKYSSQKYFVKNSFGLGLNYYFSFSNKK